MIVELMSQKVALEEIPGDVAIAFQYWENLVTHFNCVWINVHPI